MDSDHVLAGEERMTSEEMASMEAALEDEKLFEKLIRGNDWQKKIDINGQSLSHWVAKKARLAQMEQMAAKGFDFMDCDRFGRLPLNKAMQERARLGGDMQAMGWLMDQTKKGAPKKTLKTNGEIPMWVGGGLDSEDALGRSLLSVAAESGRLDLVEALVERGAQLDASSKKYGLTALMCAANWGKTHVVAWLLDRGADLSKADAQGWRAIDFARTRNHAGTIKALEEAVAKRACDQSLATLASKLRSAQLSVVEGLAAIEQEKPRA